MSGGNSAIFADLIQERNNKYQPVDCFWYGDNNLMNILDAGVGVE
jgi:hypothetical protein